MFKMFLRISCLMCATGVAAAVGENEVPVGLAEAVLGNRDLAEMVHRNLPNDGDAGALARVSKSLRG